MKLTLTIEQVQLVITALDYIARNEAGQTQMPDLCEPEDYAEFDLARDIERRLQLSLHLSSQWTTDPQTGETVRVAP